MSLPECNIPIRSFLGVDNASQILKKCAKHKIAYMGGIAVVLTLVLFVAYLFTRNKKTDFFVPWYVPLLPFAFLWIYAANQQTTLERTLEIEKLEYQLSNMDKKEYIQYKSADDRNAKGIFSGTVNAGILSSANVLGPFLRGDR